MWNHNEVAATQKNEQMKLAFSMQMMLDRMQNV